jgi:hypothetical protein
MKQHSPFTIANIESSFHEQSLTIGPAKLVGFGSYQIMPVCPTPFWNEVVLPALGVDPVRAGHGEA